MRCVPASAVGALCGAVWAMPPVVLDGRFDDWAQRPPVLIDPADTPKGSIDIGAIKVADDPTRVCFFVELGRTVNLQRLDGRLVLAIDEDGDARTGNSQHGLEGAELLVIFTPADPKNPDKAGFGVGVRRFVDGAWREVGPYVQPVAFAPTAASRNAEICIDRDSRTLAGESFRFALVAYGPDGQPIDRTETTRVALGTRPATAIPPDPDADPLQRAASTSLRVVAWNVERGGLIPKPERFARVLMALAPDVILLSELTDKESAALIKGWLDTHVPLAAAGAAADSGASGWTVAFGAGGGNLRTAVASRHPLAAPAELERVVWSDGPNRRRDVRFASAIIEVEGRRLLAGAMHLKCCGGMNTDEELTRLEEVQAIRSALRLASLAGIAPSGSPRVDGVILGGDLNLVGSVEPLELLLEGLDLDGTNLAAAQPLQLDARNAATWRDPTQPFTPGMLDFVLFSDSALAKRRAFVLDTRDLSPRWLTAHGLEADDTDEASDHLPVVVDLEWRGGEQESRR